MDEDKKTAPNILIKTVLIILRTVAGLCLAASLISLFVCAAASATLFSRGFYVSVLTDDKYITDTQNYIENEIKNVCRIYRFPYDSIKPASSKEIISELSAGYASALFDTLIYGKTPDPVSYPAAEFLKRIASYTAALPDDDMYSSETNQYYLADYFRGKADYALNSFAQERISDEIYKLMSREFIASMTVPEIAAKFIMPLSEFSVLLLALLLIGRRGGFRRRLYGTAGIVWCAAVLIFVPCMLLARYNLPAKLPVAASPLRNFLSAFLSAFIDRLYTVSAISFAAATVLLITAVIVNAKR